MADRPTTSTHDEPNPTPERDVKATYGTSLPPVNSSRSRRGSAALAVKLFSDQRKRPDVGKRWPSGKTRSARGIAVSGSEDEGQNRWIACDAGL